VEDRTFTLLEKMYSEFKEFKEEMIGFKEDMTSFKDETKKCFKTIETKIEVEVSQKLEALFDGYKTNSEKIDELSNKVDNLQFDVNNISIKVASNDNKIIEIKRDLRSVR
jgi:uncharacterized coiled-coil DUF342 family protein